MADGIFASGSPPWQQAPICSPEGTGCFSEAFLESSGSQSSHPCERETPLQAASDEGRGDSPLPPPTTQSTRGPGGIPAPPGEHRLPLLLQGGTAPPRFRGLQPTAGPPSPSLPKSSQAPVPTCSPLLGSGLFQLHPSLSGAETGWQGTDKIPQGDTAQPPIWACANSAWQSSVLCWHEGGTTSGAPC